MHTLLGLHPLDMIFMATLIISFVACISGLISGDPLIDFALLIFQYV